jgi:hypothetical protein
MTLTGREGQAKPHPLLATEREENAAKCRRQRRSPGWFVRRHRGFFTQDRLGGAGADACNVKRYGCQNVKQDMFDAEYQSALSGAPRPKKGAVAVGTLAYRETSAWTKHSAATRRQRENIFQQVLETAGDKPYAQITQATIVAGCRTRPSRPWQRERAEL